MDFIVNGIFAFICGTLRAVKPSIVKSVLIKLCLNCFNIEAEIQHFILIIYYRQFPL